MMFSLQVDYTPCFVSSKFDFTSLLSVREKGGWTNCLATPTARRARNLKVWLPCDLQSWMLKALPRPGRPGNEASPKQVQNPQELLKLIKYVRDLWPRKSKRRSRNWLGSNFSELIGWVRTFSFSLKRAFHGICIGNHMGFECNLGNNCTSNRQSNCTSDSECNLWLLWVQLFPNGTRIHVIKY